MRLVDGFRFSYKLIRRVFCSFSASLVFVCSAIAEPQVTIEFAQGVTQYADGRIEAREVSSQFDCGQRIYGIFHLEDLEPGERLILTQWKNPAGKIESVNRRQLRIPSDNQRLFLSSSIEFASGDPLSSMFDPAAGFEQYIGRWSVEVLVDGDVVETGQFQVLC